MDKLQRAIRALKIYDECMDELSKFVGHVYGRVGENAYDAALDACKRAMKAQKILHQLDPSSRPQRKPK